jgi:hemerythrin-like domain-containing protein
MREFADKCHHAKEEDILFPEMVRHGVPETGCPIAALRQEHVRGRQLVTSLAERTEAYARRGAGAPDSLMAVIGDIGQLYSSHIWKEDNMVFPMVDRLFPAPDIEHLAQRFEQAEAELGQDHEALERFARSLEYGR